MRSTYVALALLLATAFAAQARSTQDFLEMCQTDEAACLREIQHAKRALEQGPRERMRFCTPPAMQDETMVFEVTYWIGEQTPSWDRKEAAESIAAALVALYSCDRAPPIDTNGDR